MYYLAAFVLCIFSELVFSSYQSVFDTYNVLGHLYKVLAFILIYKGIFVASVRKPYEDLRQHRNMLSQIINSIPQSIFWKDTNSVYLGCNRVFARSAGLAATENIVGKRDLDLPWGSAEAAKYCADDREVMEHAQAKRHIIETQHQSDGTTIWIDTSKIPLIGNSGTVEGVLGVYEDVTRRKQVEEELVESNRHLEQRVAERTDELLHAKEVAEAANRSKSTFLANMSHEIRTPLNAVLGFSQIVLHDPNLSAENRHNLQTVNRSGEHLLTLINDVLDMAKIEAGRLVVEQAPFDLPALLTDVAEIFIPRATAKDLQIVSELQPDMLCHVQGDAGKLRQIVINLLGNAVKFTEQGGVSLRARTFRQDERSWLEVQVEDSGPGIGPQDQQRVFDAFEQSEVGRKSQGGTGLGLAISRQYARLMGGDLTVTSQPGQGACFQLILPVIAAQPPDSSSGEQPRRLLRLKPGQQPWQVLVVDDRDTNREILVKMLAPLGFSMIEAQDGQAALEAFLTYKPQLVLMDVVMPVMDGREAIRRIRALPEGHDVPIIAVSASVFEDQSREIMAAGASDFLRKPLREEELLEKVARFLPAEFEYEAEEGSQHAGEGEILFAPALVEGLAFLPEDTRQELLDAARQLDKGRILALINRQEGLAPGVAENIRSHTEAYRFDLIEEALLKTHLPREENHDS